MGCTSSVASGGNDERQHPGTHDNAKTAADLDKFTSNSTIGSVNPVHHMTEISETNSRNSENSLPFPKQGVRLPALEDFVASCGGEDALKGMTTTDVCTKYLMPLTSSGGGTSYVEKLTQDNSPLVGIANVFISHAWRYHFLDVIDAIDNHFKDHANQDSVIVWFDLFSNNQHKATTLPFEWWSTTFSEAIRDFGHTVMVLSPWNDPIPLKRAWCLYELYQSVQTKSTFEVAMSRKEEVKCWTNLNEDTFRNMLSRIDVSNAEAFMETDRQRIFAAVEQEEGGFNTLNATVLSTMKDWVYKMVNQKSTESSDNPSTKTRLAVICQSQDQFDKAEQLLEEAHALGVAKWGANSLDAASLRLSVGRVKEKRGKWQEALDIYSDCWRFFAKTLGDEHSKTVFAMGLYGSLLRLRGKHADAERVIVQTISIKERRLGVNHISTAQSKQSLAVAYTVMGKLKEADALHRESITTFKLKMGNEHSTTLTAMNNLGSVCRQLGNLDEAEELYKEVLVQREIRLGPHSRDTLDTKQCLANLSNGRSNFEQAEVLYRECIEGYTKVLGENHHTTLMCIGNCAVLYRKMGKLQQAEELYNKCYIARKQVLGEDHPDTFDALSMLANLYNVQKKNEEAEKLYLQVMSGYKTCLSEDHPKFLSCCNNYASMLASLGRWDEAEPLYETIIERGEVLFGAQHQGLQLWKKNYRLDKARHEKETKEMEAD